MPHENPNRYILERSYGSFCVGSLTSGSSLPLGIYLSDMYMPINFIKHRILISNVRSYRPRIRLDTCACLANDSTDKGKTLVRSTNHNGQLDRPVNRTEYKTLVPMDGPDYNTCPQDQRISYLVTIL